MPRVVADTGISSVEKYTLLHIKLLVPSRQKSQPGGKEFLRRPHPLSPLAELFRDQAQDSSLPT